MEPFCLKGTGTENTEKQLNKWDEFSTEVRRRAEKVKKVAEKYQLTFVELQSVFEQAVEVKDAIYWLAGVVHPIG